MSRIPRHASLRCEIPVRLVYALSESPAGTSSVLRKKTELIENQTAATRWRSHDGFVDRRAWHCRQIAIGSPGVANIIYPEADVQIRKQVESVSYVAFDASIKVSACRAVECRLLTEISETIENRKCSYGIVQRIVRRSARIASDQWG